MARQKKKSNPIVNILILAIFGIVLIVIGVRTFMGLHGNLLNITTCDPSEVTPGQYIEADLTYGYGKYIEKTTTYNHLITRTSGYYYLVDVCDKNPDGSAKDSAKWIGVSISKSEDSLYSAISNQDDAPAIHITGVVKKNTSDIQKYLNEYIKNYVDYYYEYLGETPTQSDYDYFYNEAFPYYIEIVDSGDYIFQLGLGVLIILIGIIYAITTFKKKKTDSYNQPVYGSTVYDSYSGDMNYNGNTDYSNGYNPDYSSSYNAYSTDANQPDQVQEGDSAPEADNQQKPYSAPFYRTDLADKSSGFSLKQDD